MLSDFADRQVIASVFPYLKSEWQLTDTQLGSLVTIVNWTMLLIAMPVSILMDRWSRKKIVGLMAIVWSLATLASAFAKNFTQLFTARAVIGFGEGGYGPGGSSLIGALFPKRMTASLMGYFWAGGPIGGIIGVIAGGYIAVNFGWRHAFGIVAIPGFILALLLLFTVKDYKTVELAVTDQAKGTKKKIKFKEIVMMLTTPTLLFVWLGEAAQMFCSVTIGNWLPSYINRYNGLPMDKASMRAAGVFLVAAIGTMLAGWVLNKWKQKWPKAIMMGTGLFCVFNAVLWVVAFGFLNGPIQYYTILIGAIGAGACFGAAYSVSQEAIHPGLRVTSLAMLTIFHQGLGQALGPLFGGILSDMYNLRTALMIISFVPILAGLFFFIGGLYYDRDVAKVEKVELSVD